MEDFFASAFEAPMTRRRLIKAIAVAGAATWGAGLPGIAVADGRRSRRSRRFGDFVAIAPSSADALQVPEGYELDVVIKWGDEFADGLNFGYNCDYSAFFPLRSRGHDGGGIREGIVWVNHEYVWPIYVSNWKQTDDPGWNPFDNAGHRAIMEAEKKEVGGSIVHLRKQRRGPWEVVHNSRYSRRFYGDGPPIPYDGPVAGTSLVPNEGTVLGTLANCSGATTPWGTVLTCEENFQSYGLKRAMPFALGWFKGEADDPDELHEKDLNYYIGEPGTNMGGDSVGDEFPFYGYVGEIDPFTGNAVKHTALGRFHHENVAMHAGRNGRVVCYMGDDSPASPPDGLFYKFVSERRLRRGMSRREAMTLLAEGQLYVAEWLPTANDPNVNDGTGRWHAIDMADPEALAFTTKWVEDNIVRPQGGDFNVAAARFRVPRAEDCEINAGNHRQVLIALTTARGRPAAIDPAAYGVVRLIEESRENADSLAFRWAELLEGGPHTGFANPDNMGFLSKDELLVVTDISTSSLNVPSRGFEWHANNAVFYVPLRGPNANVAFRFANAPVGAELTGPTFVKSASTLFLNVQHPGENISLNANPNDPSQFPSWWPEGNRTAGTGTAGKPKPSLVAIRKEGGGGDDDDDD
jgi:secreted PhoX family phosphatase